MRHFARVPYVAASALLAACGGGGYGGGGTNSQNAAPGGIWSGTDSDSPLAVTGIIDEQGQLRFIRADGVQYVGTVTTSGNSISASFDGYTPFGSTFSDGSTHETGMLTGTIEARVSITASTQSTTDKGAVSKGTLAMTFNPLYNQASSLAAIAGNYAEAGSSTAVSIDASGAIVSQDASTGCVVNGSAAIIDASYDAYSVQATYASCTGAAAVLNGITFSGLATLDTSVSPTQLIAGVTGSSGGTTYALVYTLTHQ